MLVAAAVCPQTPLLVPEVASGAAEELADVRKAAFAAVAALGSGRPDLVVAVAAGGGSGAREVRFGGSFRRFGVELEVGGGVGVGGESGVVGGGPSVADREVCVGLLIGRWLLDGGLSGALPVREGWEVGDLTGLGECARIGRELAERAERVALLIMGDGSARRGVKAPGYLDERAVQFDDEVARALGDADARALAAIDPTTASDLMAAGRAPWQVLAGAVGSTERPWRGELLSYRAPYGVGYFTAVWTPQG